MVQIFVHSYTHPVNGICGKTKVLRSSSTLNCCSYKRFKVVFCECCSRVQLAPVANATPFAMRSPLELNAICDAISPWFSPDTGCAGSADNFWPADRCAAPQWKSLCHGQSVFPHGLCTGYDLCYPNRLIPLLLLACLALLLSKAAPVLTMKAITLRAGTKGCVEDIEDASGTVQSCIRCPAHGRKVCTISVHRPCKTHSRRIGSIWTRIAHTSRYPSAL